MQSKVLKIRISEAERKAWWDRIVEFELPAHMAKAVRECVRMEIGYEVVDDKAWDKAYEFRLPEFPPAVLDVVNYPKPEVDIVVRVCEAELNKWRIEKVKRQYSSMEKMIIGIMRKALSVEPLA